jgi:hypothetical protein
MLKFSRMDRNALEWIESKETTRPNWSRILSRSFPGRAPPDPDQPHPNPSTVGGSYRRGMDGEPGDDMVADGGPGDGAAADGGAGHGTATADGGLGQVESPDGGPGAEADAGPCTGAAAYPTRGEGSDPGTGTNGDLGHEGAAATDAGLDDDTAGLVFSTI